MFSGRTRNRCVPGSTKSGQGQRSLGATTTAAARGTVTKICGQEWWTEAAPLNAWEGGPGILRHAAAAWMDNASSGMCPRRLRSHPASARLPLYALLRLHSYLCLLRPAPPPRQEAQRPGTSAHLVRCDGVQRFGATQLSKVRLLHLGRDDACRRGSTHSRADYAGAAAAAASRAAALN